MGEHRYGVSPRGDFAMEHSMAELYICPGGCDLTARQLHLNRIAAGISPAGIISPEKSPGLPS